MKNNSLGGGDGSSKEGGPRIGSALPEKAGFKAQLRGPGKGKGELLNLVLVGVMSVRLDFRGSGDGPASRISPSLGTCD